MRTLGILFLLALVAWGCRTSPPLPVYADFRVGMERLELKRTFGEPLQVTTFRKTGDAIWGAIEDYWPTVPAGSTVEVWSYASRGDSGMGRTELYFLDGATTVSAKGFSPEGVVYEAEY